VLVMLVATILLAALLSGLAAPIFAKPLFASSQAISAQATPPAGPGPEGTVRFERISTQHGLSNSTVHCVFQDSRGFIWFGTEDGLNRYDGYSFTVYRHDPEDTNSLANNDIRALVEDQDGILWIGTFGGGLDRFDPQTGNFTHFQYNPDLPWSESGPSSNYVMSIAQDMEGALWIAVAASGVDRFDPQTGEFSHAHSLSGFSPEIRDIHVDRSGVIWFATAGRGLYSLDRSALTGEDDTGGVPDAYAIIPALGDIDFYTHNPRDAYSLSSDVVLSIFEDSEGVIWVGTGEGLNRLDRETGQFIRYRHHPGRPNSLSSDIVFAIHEDREGTLWLGTLDGLNTLARSTGRFTHYQNVPNDPYSLSSNFVVSLYEDQSGTLWVGTVGGGVNKADNFSARFSQFRNDPNDSNSLSNNFVQAILQDEEGALWIGTLGGGLNRLDRTGQWDHYVNLASDPHSLSSNLIQSVYLDRQGVLWVGTDGSGLNRFDPQTEKAIYYHNIPDDPGSLRGDDVHWILEDADGVLWLGTNAGLERFDRETERFTLYLSYSVFHIFQDSEGALWLATNVGLYKYDRRFTYFQHDAQDPNTLSDNGVIVVMEDRSGVLWVGTAGGLNRFDRATQTFHRYTGEDGLPHNAVLGILEDQLGNLWLSSENGISRFDPQAEVFTNYDIRDGLQGSLFVQRSFYQSADGEMFFGGVNGFNAFYPDEIEDNPHPPPIALTSLTLNGEEINVGAPVEALEAVTFHWPDDSFEFEFAALNYSQPDKNVYAYMLEGFDEDWIYVGGRRFGRYTNLPGGTYTLRLKGTNNDGVWNEAGTSLRVTIVPPVWATWWFRILSALVLVGVVFGGYRLRVRSVEARSRQLEDQVSRRTRELGALNSVAAVASRSLDLGQVLMDVLEKTLEVSGADAGGIYLLQEEAGILTIAAHLGLEGQLVAEIDHLAVGEGFSGRVAQTCEPLAVQDLTTDPRLARAAVTESGFESLAAAPLVSRAQVVGSLFVMTRDRHQFTESDLAMLTAIGDQIGVAIQNARLFEAEQHRADQFRVISEVGRRLTVILDVDEILHQVVRLVQETFGYYHVGIGLVEGDDVVYRVGAGPLWDGPDFQFKPGHLKVGEEGLTGWVAAAGEPVLAPDVSQEPRYVWMEGSETRSELVVPVLVKGRVVGVLDAQSTVLGGFDETDLAVLQSLANQTGAAIENAHLYEQAQQAAVLEERQRLARELHDSVAQSLYGVTLYAEAAERLLFAGQADQATDHLREMQSTAQDALGEMRLLVFELRPPILEKEGLVVALQERLEAVENRIGLQTEFFAEGEIDLSPKVEQGLYRIAQEALNNALKHARAERITVSLHQDQHSVVLEIADDGIGFDPVAGLADSGLGLDGMYERADQLGGQLTIESGSGEGTKVRAEVTL
jgi:signal transduction histidine kinase/ligand-binding sensor domain-containing protein